MDNITLRDFLEAFYPDDAEPICLRQLPPKAAPPHILAEAKYLSKNIETARRQLLPGTAMLKALQSANKKLGIYFCVNAGGHDDKSITRFNAFFAEDDTRPIQEQAARLDAAPLPTSIRVGTRKSVHAYWLTEGDVSPEDWREIQERLIAHFGGDPTIKNPSRVMRLPFFEHVSYVPADDKLAYKHVTLDQFEPSRRYTGEQMRAAFPPAPVETKSAGKATRQGASAQPHTTGKVTTLASVLERQRNGEALNQPVIAPGDYSDGEIVPADAALIEGTIERIAFQLANAANGTKDSTLFECGLILHGLAKGGLAAEERITETLLAAVALAGQDDPTFDLNHARQTARHGYDCATATTLAGLRARAQRHTTQPTQASAPQSVQSVQSVQDSAKPEPWELPVPFREFDLPTFPLESLSSWHRSYAEQLAEATQTPADLAAMQSLSVIAATIARNVEIEARQGWREPLCIFTLTVAESANRKSAVVSEVTRPLERFEGDLLAEMRETIAEAVNERRILEARLEKAQKDCAKLDGAELAERKEEARKIAIEIEHHMIPVAPRFFVDDVTAEALASKMAEQGGRIALFSAEGGIFETMAGRYSNGAPNIDVYLKGHAGDSLRVDRRQRSERIERPALTIGLAVQSDVIRGLAQKPGFRGRGLLGRFLYSLPQSRLGSRKSRTKSISMEAAHTYERYLIRLAAIKPAEVEDGEPEPITLRLSGEADDYLAQFQDEIEPELAEGGELSTISEWAGKLCGAAVRLAGILHCADHAMNEPCIPPEVPASTFKRAVQIARYLIPHSLAAHAEMGADPLIEDARYLLRWLIRERLEDASKRDIHRGCRGRFKKITELDAVLALLEDHNYLRPLLPPDGSGTRPGRKASQIYSVNPALYLTGHNGHNGQNPIKNAEAATGENDIYLSGQNGQNGHNTPVNGNSVHSVHSVHNPTGWNFEPPPFDELPETEAVYTPPEPTPAKRRVSV